MIGEIKRGITDINPIEVTKKIFLNRDPARLYGVETRALNQAVMKGKSKFIDKTRNEYYYGNLQEKK